jgi:endo-1,4-beta-xylanase
MQAQEAHAQEKSAQGAVLHAQFTQAAIRVDGMEEPAWKSATPESIAICMSPDLKKQETDCKPTAMVRALWNGPLLYLLITVTDPEITTASAKETDRSGVKVFVDQYNDKFPKFEEDDGYVMVSAAGQQTGNLTNAGLRYYPAVWQTHLESYAATIETDGQGNRTGYTVELAWRIGDRPLKTGTELGMEFAVYSASAMDAAAAATGAAAPAAGKSKNESILFWSSGNNHGVDSNTMWGTVVLSGHGAGATMPLNTFMLATNIRKATPATNSVDGLVRGIWLDETAVARTLERAKAVMAAPKTQREIDAANDALYRALQGLRRKGKYPDPHDLPVVNSLPDPFRFFNGGRVKTLADWDRRREEIKELAQYYEFGFMPAKPETLTATSAAETTAPTKSGGTLHYRTITISIRDKGNSAEFSPVLYFPATGKAPYPVIVEEDIFASPAAAPPRAAFLNGGYAVLSIPTWDAPKFGHAGIASDDGNHTGAFFTLYPYQLDNAGDDRGVLLAWAWGASRGVDALEYLAAHDPAYANLLDLKKLVITGFSRWGKTALLAGLLDDRFQVTAPGGSGAGGAAPYRYDSFGNVPFRKMAELGNIYPWGRTPGTETFGDHVRHQTHNSNEMIRRFLNDQVPAPVEPRMYLEYSWGAAERLPYDRHELIAAIAPRAVLIDNTDDDYADNAEGDSIGFEGAMPVYKFLGVPQNLALDLYMGGGGHSLKPSQAENIVNFSNFVLFGMPLTPAVETQLETDPYLNAGIYDKYYGGLKTMMPWESRVSGDSGVRDRR